VAVALKFRHRVGLLVILAATALITVTAVAAVLGTRGERQLAGIETLYVPLIELDRDLKTQFAEIPRALEDAATAADDARLGDADQQYATVVQRLRAGRREITDNGGDPAALEAELAAYYATARDIAAALVKGVPAGEIDAKIDAMRRAQVSVVARLDLATTPDRRRLASAFATARASQRDAIWIDIVVASSALVLISLLSWRIIRDTVRALHAVAAGVARLARGEFAHEIEVTTHDELGDLAREANRTALQLREYRRLLEDRAEELARASRYKSEFLANMSHELRTPLNSIMVLSKVLSENPDRGAAGSRDRQVEFATLIHKSGEELLALINEVLDLSKIEAGKQEVVCEALPLTELQDYIRSMFRPLAVQHHLAFTVEAADDLPAAIRTDRKRLTQIVKNLIANAFKFTERGGVTVRVSRGQPPRSTGVAVADPIVIAVSDTGIGIAADKQAWIFEAFAQADTGISRRFGGTGLGLAIARQLATRLGGDLVVDSTEGAGSTFSLVLPIAGPAEADDTAARPPPAAPPPAAAPRPREGRASQTTGVLRALGAAEPHGPEPALDGKTVLVVDDDMRTVYALSNALSAKRLQVLTAADGQEALDELDRHPALDLVVIDVMMPRMDGLEAIRRVRAQPRFRDLPIIALTATTMSDERERCLAAGASDHLAKPVDLGQLLGLLRTWLAARGGSSQIVK